MKFEKLSTKVFASARDPEFVEQIERNKLAKEWLTLQITQKALLKFFPMYSDEILEDLVKMLLFDAWVISNNLQIKEVKEPSTQVGLKNIMSRYVFLSDRKVSIRQEIDAYTVRIPLLELQEK